MNNFSSLSARCLLSVLFVLVLLHNKVDRVELGYMTCVSTKMFRTYSTFGNTYFNDRCEVLGSVAVDAFKLSWNIIS